jgi:hypothetical protein
MLHTARSHVHTQINAQPDRPRRPRTAARRAAAVAGILAVALAAGACTAGRGPADQLPASAAGDAAAETAALAPTPPTLTPQRPATPKPRPKPTPKPTPRPPASTRAPETTPAGGAALADGRYPTLLKHVDPDRAEITVDVVQVFRGAAARGAAAAAGNPDAEMYENWITNDSSRVRVLRVASRGEITGLFPTEWCHDEERRTTLKRLADNLAKNPSLAWSPIVFWVTVRDGLVRRLDVEDVQLVPAC